MTRSQALEEARRRWGPEAFTAHCPAARPSCLVMGGLRPDGIWPRGLGDTWEDAFEDADRRARGGMPVETDAT